MTIIDFVLLSSSIDKRLPVAHILDIVPSVNWFAVESISDVHGWASRFFLRIHKCNSTGSSVNLGSIALTGSSLNLGIFIRKVETVYVDLRNDEKVPVRYVDLQSMECDPPEDTSLCSQYVRQCIDPARKEKLTQVFQCCDNQTKYTSFCQEEMKCY